MSTLIVGCGYLGRRVGRILVARGEAVFGSTRSPAKADELAKAGIEPVVADALDPGSLAALPPADRALICFGYDRGSGIPLRTVYVEGLRNVLERLAGRVKRVVYASSTGVYGQHGGEWVDEDAPTEPPHESGRVAVEAEALIRGLAYPPGTEPIVLRFAGLYGPGRLPRRASLERGESIPGDPEKYLNLVHIHDAAKAAVAALDRGRPGRVYLVSDDRPVPRREYFTLVARLLGAPAPLFVAPEPGRADAGREDANKRVSNRRMREELGVAPRYPDLTAGIPAALTDD